MTSALAVVGVAAVAVALPGVIAAEASAATPVSGPTATFAKTSDWGTGFVGQYVIRNTGTRALDGWRLEFAVPAGTRVTSAWSGRLASSGGGYAITPEDWTRKIAPGATVTIGFQGENDRPFTAPSTCLLDGAPCDGSTTPPVDPPRTDPPRTDPPRTDPPAPAATLTAAFAKTDDWGSGFVGRYTIHNAGTTAVDGWRLQFDAPPGGAITSAWSGKLASSNGRYTLTPEDWTRKIAPGASVEIGFEGTNASRFTTLANCTLNGAACAGGTTPPIDPPDTDPPVTDPPVSGGPTSSIYAPYVDMTLYPQFSFGDAVRQSGTKHFSLAFVVSRAPCQASWGTFLPLGEDQFVLDSLADLRRAGGDAIVSFGGALNQELALTCPTVDALTAEYQRVIDRYGVRSLDFDIEGAAQGDAVSVDRRSKAIAKLQAAGRAAGRPVTVSLTLPTLPTGLTADGLKPLRSAIANGVEVSVVNLMAMDYFDPSLNVAGHMGDLAIQAATSLHVQLKTLYPSRTDAQLWAMVGITPMLGINDNPAEIFTLADARKVADFAEQKGIGRLATWSANRDAPCPAPSSATQNTCSGVAGAPWAFAGAFGNGRG